VLSRLIGGIFFSASQRGKTRESQLRRFIGTRSGRKAQYALALVEALDLTRAPRPLHGVLAHVGRDTD
jgi:hypothetical protein